MLGKPVPDFSLPSTGNTTFDLASARGSKLVLYFYPKDNTPGCTQQGSDFRDSYKEFKRAECEVVGVETAPRWANGFVPYCWPTGIVLAEIP